MEHSWRYGGQAKPQNSRAHGWGWGRGRAQLGWSPYLEARMGGKVGKATWGLDQEGSPFLFFVLGRRWITIFFLTAF